MKAPDMTSAIVFVFMSNATGKPYDLKHTLEVCVLPHGTPTLEDNEGNTIALTCNMKVYYDPSVACQKQMCHYGRWSGIQIAWVDQWHEWPNPIWLMMLRHLCGQNLL